MRTRSLQVQHLSKLVHYLIAGTRHIERQKALIQELERDSHDDTAQAQQTPQQMEEIAQDLSFREGQAAQGARARRGLKTGRGRLATLYG